MAIPYIKTNFCWLLDMSLKYVCERSYVGNDLKLDLLLFCWNNPYGFRVNQMEGILFKLWQVSMLQFLTKSWYTYTEKVDIFEVFIQHKCHTNNKTNGLWFRPGFLYYAKFPGRMNTREIISGKTDWLYSVSLISCWCLALKDPHMQILAFIYLDFSLSLQDCPSSLQLCPFQAVRLAY